MDGEATTVTLPVPVPTYELFELFDAVALTAYVPGCVPEGEVLFIVREADCPGLRVTELVEKLVDHPEGWLEPKVKVLAEQPEESLSVTETV